MDNLNAGVFQYSLEAYKLDFEKILVGITCCYKMIIEDKVSVPLNDENSIRDFLLLKYLKSRSIKKKCQLTNYRFESEIPEYTTPGRVDIKIISKNDFEIDEAYYVIKCKKLDKKKFPKCFQKDLEYK